MSPQSDIKIEASWQQALATEFTASYFIKLRDRVRNAYQETTIYPPPPQLFRAFNLCPLTQTKVVILGQDPYHGPDQANGLAFSVKAGTPLPPSLRNIYQEIERDIGSVVDRSGELEHWAKQGVLLLNTCLTVNHKQPGSHRDWGWEQFTDAVVTTVNEHSTACVFLLWGAHAKAKESLITDSSHLVLTAPHPSPLSAHRGFFGRDHFGQTNDFLKRQGKTPITW